MEMLKKESRLNEILLSGWHPYAWIIAMGMLLYFRTIFFDFSYFDDLELIVQNKAFLSNIFNVFHAFCMKVYPTRSLFTPYYRPLLMVSFILNAQTGGVSPFVYHLTNVLIHLVVSSLVFALFVRLGYKRALSLFFAVVFSIHPVLAQAVAWVPGRNDSMLAAFSLASFISFLKFLDSRSRKSYLWHLFFLLMAVFTKESGVILIIMCYLYCGLVRGKEVLASVWKVLLAGHVIVCALFFIPRYFVTLGSEPITLYDVWNLIIHQVPAIVQLIGKAVFPVYQSVFPTMRDSSSGYGLIMAALIIFAIVLKKGSRRLILFGAAWLILFLIPPLLRSRALSIGDVLEHRMYLPIIGLMIIIMEFDLFRASSAAVRRMLCVSGAVILIVFFAKAYAHCDNFRNSTVFWENAVKASPRSAFARIKLGQVYYWGDRFDESFEQTSKAIQLDLLSTFIDHYYLGQIYLKKGMVAQAEKEFRKTIALVPANDLAYVPLGVICYESGRADEAEALWKMSLKENAENFYAAKNLAIYYAEKKDYKAAREYANVLRRHGMEVPPEFLKTIGEK